jgi:hypothetical protein
MDPQSEGIPLPAQIDRTPLVDLLATLGRLQRAQRTSEAQSLDPSRSSSGGTMNGTLPGTMIYRPCMTAGGIASGGHSEAHSGTFRYRFSVDGRLYLRYSCERHHGGTLRTLLAKSDGIVTVSRI